MANHKFVCFRYSIVPAPRSLLSYTESAVDKKRIFQDNFLKNNDYVVGAAEYAIRIIDKIGNLYYGKLSKKIIFDKFDITPVDIKESESENWPFCEFICDNYVQIVVIRHNTSLFQNLNRLKRILNSLANQVYKSSGYIVSFEAILEKTAFWDVVKSADKIYFVQFSLDAPNILGGKAKASEFMHEMKESYNITQANFKLENKDGELDVNEENVDSYREYADKGAGWWRLRIGRNGVPKTVSSIENAKKVSVEETESVPEMLNNAYEKFKDNL